MPLCTLGRASVGRTAAVIRDPRGEQSGMADAELSLPYGPFRTALTEAMLPSPRQTARMMRRELMFAANPGNSSLCSLFLHDTSKALAAGGMF